MDCRVAERKRGTTPQPELPIWRLPFVGAKNSQKLPAQNLSIPLMPGREKKRNTVKSVQLFAVPGRLYIAFSGADRFDGGH
jgi:hypothetical protein